MTHRKRVLRRRQPDHADLVLRGFGVHWSTHDGPRGGWRGGARLPHERRHPSSLPHSPRPSAAQVDGLDVLQFREVDPWPLEYSSRHSDDELELRATHRPRPCETRRTATPREADGLLRLDAPQGPQRATGLRGTPCLAGHSDRWTPSSSSSKMMRTPNSLVPFLSAFGHRSVR